MKVVLPKGVSGVTFARLFEPTMSEFDIERLLPSLFYLVVTRGRNKGLRLANDPTDIAGFVDKLCCHDMIEGFDRPDGHDLLDKWLRDSVLHIARRGKGGGGGEQIDYVLPITLLSYKTGLPAETSRQRNVPRFLYRLMREALGESGLELARRERIATIFLSALGSGIQIGPAPYFDGVYDGKTNLDIQTLLAVHYLAGFRPTPAVGGDESANGRLKHKELEPPPALPSVAKAFGADLLLLTRGYSGKMPALGLTRSLMAIANFELFIYTLRLMHATNALVLTGVLPPGMRPGPETVPPEVYVDFTGNRGELSDDLARGCVERDLEELRGYLRSLVLIRTIEHLIDKETNQRVLNESGKDGPRYLKGLVDLRYDRDVLAAAAADIRVVEAGTKASCSEYEQDEVNSYFSELRRDKKEALERYVDMLVEQQKNLAMGNYGQWFWSVGGLKKSFGILSGNLRGRRSWRYAMGDDLLAALVQLCLAKERPGDVDKRFEEVAIRQRVSLRGFLSFLEERFGILVDRPPASMDSASARAAARRNLDAFRRRLGQMGLMEELSDDFTAQYVSSSFRAREGSRK